MNIDGAAHVPFETRIEETQRILERGTLGECQLHHSLIGFTGADNAVVRPHRYSSPLPLLDHVRIGLFDHGAYPGERGAAPVAQLLDPRVDQSRCSFVCWRCVPRHCDTPPCAAWIVDTS